MDYLLGIDGGGTGCRAALADRAGRILGRGAAGPANIASDRSGACANILAASRDALKEAGLQLDLAYLQAGLGLAGANAAGAADWLRDCLPFRRMRVETDAITAAKGALGLADGVVAAMGTGSVLAVQKGGAIRSFGGWGLIFGDEASGAWLGRAILSRALRAVDGFAQMTPLLHDLLARHGGPSGVVAFGLVARPADLAKLAPELVESPDTAAKAVVQEAVDLLRDMLQKLGAGPDLPVTFLGGLGAVYSRHLCELPQRPPLGSALDGALILAREAG